MTSLERLLLEIRQWQQQQLSGPGQLYDPSCLSEESDDLLDYL